MKKITGLFILCLFLVSGFFIFFAYAQFDDSDTIENSINSVGGQNEEYINKGNSENLQDSTQYSGFNDEKGIEGGILNNLEQENNQNIEDGNNDNLDKDIDGKSLNTKNSSPFTKGPNSGNESDSINVTFNLDGGYWVEDGSTADKVVEFYTDGNNMVGTTSWRTPSKAGYECNGNKCMFDGWYLDNGERWTGYVESDLTVYANWLPFEDLVVTKNDITFTIMDRNLGATSSGTGCTNSNNSVCGYYFQWGNNYGFKYNVNNTYTLVNGEIKLSEKATDWEGHISNYYNGIWRTENPWTDGDFGGGNLWGYSGSLDLDIDKQGPCPNGYHVPNRQELDAVLNLFFDWSNISTISNNLKLSSNIWSSTPNGKDNAYFLSLNSSYLYSNVRISGLAVRCFKNEKNKTIKFETNGGMGLEDGITVRRWEKNEKLPGTKKSGNKFLGRYLNSDFSGDPVETNYIIDDTESDIIKLYAKWQECGEGYMESVKGDKCVSLDTVEIDSIDGGMISIMKENIGNSSNGGWSEGLQGVCPRGYHVPTMQDWNVLFVSRCEKHTILGDGICDVKDLDRLSYRSDRDFMFLPKDSNISKAFGNEMSVVYRDENMNSMYSFNEFEEYYRYICEDIENTCGHYGEDTGCWDQYDYEYRYYCGEYFTDEFREMYRDGIYGGGLGAYWTSTPAVKILGETGLRLSYYYINTSETEGNYYNPVLWITINNEEIPVRCFKDDYISPDRMILLDLIDEDDLNEYNELERKIRSGELELPEDKQQEIYMLMFMDGNVKNSIKTILSDIDFDIDNMENDEDKEYFQSLKLLLDEIVNIDDDNREQVISNVESFDWDKFNTYTCRGFDCNVIINYMDLSYMISYLLVGDEMYDYDQEEIYNLIQEIKGYINSILNKHDFFTDFDRELLYTAMDDLENCRNNDDLLYYFDNLHYEVDDLLDRYEQELTSETASRYKRFFSFVFSIMDTSLDIVNVGEFISKAKAYLGTDNWLFDNGGVNYKEMVTQEYLQDEFAKMGYRVILTSRMSADEIREKIKNIKGITFARDEYLALIDVNGEEINIDGGMKSNNRGYVKVKKIVPKGEGWSSGGGGVPSSDVSEDSSDNKENENVIEKDTGIQDSQLVESDLNQNSQSDNVESVDDFGGDTNNGGMDSSLASSQGLQQQYSPEFQQAYEFAKGNGITTKSTIKEAKMDGKLTRIEMAKMLSYYAINVMGKTPDITKNVKFRDVTKKIDERYDNGVTLAYQLGIMGQNMPRNRFRPNDEVSRAEFVTALSRMLYQTSDGEYEKTARYYMPHMAKLYNEGIVNDTNPGMKERRGYVMIMLMRSVSI